MDGERQLMSSRVFLGHRIEILMEGQAGDTDSFQYRIVHQRKRGGYGVYYLFTSQAFCAGEVERD